MYVRNMVLITRDFKKTMSIIVIGILNAMNFLNLIGDSYFDSSLQSYEDFFVNFTPVSEFENLKIKNALGGPYQEKGFNTEGATEYHKSGIGRHHMQ